MFYDSSSRCRGLVYYVWLWYFLIILTYFLYSPNSFRQSVASSAFKSGVIQLQGDLKSDAYKRFLSFSLDDELYVALKMKQHILKVKSRFLVYNNIMLC